MHGACATGAELENHIADEPERQPVRKRVGERHGQGGKRDLAQAEQWLQRAHQENHAGAAAGLGRLYLERGDSTNGIALLEAAVARGHAGARSDLGEAYLTGNHVEQDIGRGLELLTAAAEAGIPSAAFLLAETYQDGNGVSMDAELAERWYRQASDSGAIYARAGLGVALMRGDGAIDQNVEEGYRLLRETAEQGHPGAQATLGIR